MPSSTVNPPESLSAADALAQYPQLRQAQYRLAEEPGRLRMQHRNDWQFRLVLSLFLGAVLLVTLLHAVGSGHFGADNLCVGTVTLLALLATHLEHEVTIDLHSLTVTRSLWSFLPCPLRTRTWKITEGMQITAFFHSDGEGGDWHQLALVDGRHRLPLTPPDDTSDDESLEIIKLGNALAQLLGVPFTGYAKRWRFYWP